MAAVAADIFWIKDKVDYDFVKDERIVGTWQAVDFVKNIDDFVPGKRFWNPTEENPFAFDKLAFTSAGDCLLSKEGSELTPITYFRHTKGHLLHLIDKVDMLYTIKSYPDGKYLFFQWKSGDYTFRGMKPWYYVIKQVDTNDYLDLVPDMTRSDDTNLPFVNDTALVGKWKVLSIQTSAVEIEKEVYDHLQRILETVEFTSTGQVLCQSIDDSVDNSSFIWTKGSLVSANEPITEAYYFVVEDGKTYLLLPWIDANVIYRGHGPNYYVLEKVE